MSLPLGWLFLTNANLLDGWLAPPGSNLIAMLSHPVLRNDAKPQQPADAVALASTQTATLQQSKAEGAKPSSNPITSLLLLGA